MPIWVSGWERIPDKPALYFVKANGNKHLLSLNEFHRKMDISETFLWLDESDYDKTITDKIIGINYIDEYAQFDRQEISQKFLTPYEPMIPKSIVINTFHKYYLKIIAQLRVENSRLSKMIGKNYMIEKDAKPPIVKTINGDSLIDKIKLLNNNPFFEINNSK